MASTAALDLVISLKGDAEEKAGRLSTTLSTVGGVARGLASGALVAAGGGVLALGAGMAKAVTSGLSMNNTLEQTRAKMIAFTGSNAEAEKVLDQVQKRAASTPFTFNEMAEAAAAFLPLQKQTNIGWEKYAEQAEVLAALNPAEGLAGAAFALREAASGDFLSIVERFNLPKKRLMELKAQGIPALEAVKITLGEMGVSTSLVAGLAQTAQGRWSTFTDTLTGLAATATKPMFTGLSQGLGTLQSKLDANMPMLQAVATAIGEGLGRAFEWLTGTGIPAAVGAFERIRSAVADVVGDFRDGFNEAGILGAIQNGLGRLWDMGAPKLAEFATRLLGWVSTTMPTWVSRLGELGMALVQWISASLPGLADRLGEARHRLLSWVVDSLPTWGAKLAELGGKLGKWVLDALPGLGANLGKAAGKLIGWTITTIAELAPKLLVMAGKFIGWVATDVLPYLPDALAKIAEGLWNFLSSAAREIEPHITPLANKFLEWIQDSVLPYLGDKLMAILRGMREWLVGTALPWVGRALLSLGGAVVDGIKQGISDAWSGFTRWLGDQVMGIPQTVVQALRIGSPSRVMAEQVGKPIVQGIAQGAFDATEWTRMGGNLRDRALRFAGTDIQAAQSDMFGQGRRLHNAFGEGMFNSEDWDRIRRMLGEFALEFANTDLDDALSAIWRKGKELFDWFAEGSIRYALHWIQLQESFQENARDLANTDLSAAMNAMYQRGQQLRNSFNAGWNSGGMGGGYGGGYAMSAAAPMAAPAPTFAPAASPIGRSGGNTTVVHVHVAGSVVTEDQLADMVQQRMQRRVVTGGSNFYNPATGSRY